MNQLQSFQSILQWLKVPVAKEKLEGPSTQLTFLGIELDTVLMVRRLPTDKLHELKSVVVEKDLQETGASVSSRQTATCLQSRSPR